ncbi:MAG: UDP-N-acetylmuramoyl-L-alanyl-D-glutamate--2,6-diaminopimelate ligase [Candidatus Nomurabacteria bacterium]|nr:UDP-N-acetylmuramoyl-L-alanyl-D-glutamate--2,6-diaminopimelate ligase [Candidatus Nomurabacteria bacterium]
MNLLKNLKIKRRVIASLVGAHFYGNPSSKLKIIGVTGTNGKTTTATMLYRLTTALGYKAGLIGTVENILVDESRPSTHTTPGPIALNKLLKEMAEKGCEYVFMEVSSHAIDQKRIAGIHFVGGIFTNLTHDHLDYHKTFERYFLAKKTFFDSLPKSAFALSNADDLHGIAMITDTKAKKITYGFSGKEDFSGEIVKLGFSGIQIYVSEKEINSSLIGKFNAYNILAVYSTSILLGFNQEEVIKKLATILPPVGRFEYFTSENKVLGVVDFAHTPDALEKIILTTRDILPEGGKVISVFGCGGDRDPLKRRIMGKISAELSDISIFTSDNPRSENPQKIIEMMRTDLSMSEVAKIKIIIDRTDAINEACKIARSGDVVLLLGKGHEGYLEIKGVKHPWNDMEKLKQALK